MRNLYEVDINSPAHFLGHFLAGTDELKSFTGGTGINTDNFPLVEFSMITDLSPNFNILQEISELNYVPSEKFNINKKPGEQGFYNKVERINQQLRREIRSSVRDYQ